MKSLFYILSFITIGAGAWFAYDNKNNLVEQQTITKETLDNKNRVKATIRKQEAIRDDLNEQISKAKDDIADTEAQLEAAKVKEGRHNNTIASLESQQRDIEAELAKFEELLARVEEALRGQNISSIEEVPEKIEELRTESLEKLDNLQSLELVNEGLTKKVARETDQKNTAEGRLADIRTNVRRNSMEARITSVNSSWGFVIINAGSDNSNIASNTELVVKRGSQNLGTLKAATVSPNQTICDIDADLAYSLRPGDRVILKEALVK